MNKMLSTAIALLCLSGTAQADVFNMGPGLTNLEMVTVGDPGNAGEFAGSIAGGGGPKIMYGSVSSYYCISKYEVTAAQYADFLNAKAKTDRSGLYSYYMGVPGGWGCGIQQSGSGTLADPWTYSVASDWANRPVNYVSYWDACRFANWLQNGQGDGDTENGAYTLNGYKGSDGHAIQRNAGAKWYLPSEDEWYKAAYYKSGGTDAGFWDYPTQSDSVPSNDLVNPDPGNNANFEQDLGCTINSPYYRTPVGEFENSESAYGTFDQGGNVWEWNETPVYDGNFYRGLRGGSFLSNDEILRSYYRNYYDPTGESSYFGFRVAAAVPEPSSLLALTGGLASILALKRRRL